MKTIGLIGGMSWESTVEYYRIINETVNGKLGGHHSGKLILYSVDFDEIVKLMKKDDWKEISERIKEVAQRLEKAGADFILICTNTIHKVAEEVEKSINIPLIHIVDVTAEEIKKKGLKTVGLLGTKTTMEDNFYKIKLKEHGIEVIIPEKNERELVDRIIFDELCRGIINPSSKDALMKIIDKLQSKGAEGIILGCTELPLIIKQEDVEIPIFDTTAIHAKSAVELALRNFNLPRG